MINTLKYAAINCSEYRLLVNVMPGHSLQGNAMKSLVANAVAKSVSSMHNVDLLEYAVADSHIVVIVHTKDPPETVLMQLINDITVDLIKAAIDLKLSDADEIFDSAIITPAQ